MAAVVTFAVKVIDSGTDKADDNICILWASVICVGVGIYVANMVAYLEFDGDSKMFKGNICSHEGSCHFLLHYRDYSQDSYHKCRNFVYLSVPADG